MKQMIKHLIYFTIFISGIAILSSCEKEPEEKPDEITIINNWIWDTMNDIYLWADYVSSYWDPDTETDPEAFFYKLLHPDDRFSWIVDDIETLINSFAGVELSNGISPGWALISGTDDVIAIVEYVTKGSPAESSGIKRGDIIIEVDGTKMTRNNYYSLFYKETATYGFGEWTQSGIVPTGESISLTAIELNQNPVQYDEIIEYEGKKIGYLVYTHFTAGKDNVWLNELDAVLNGFMQEPVDEVVIDIRYNPGGSVAIAEHIAGSLVPADNVNNQDIFTQFIWNDDYNQFFKEFDYDEDGEPDGEDSEWLVIKFSENAYNLNLSNVYILTSSRSASACELLITGIEAYNNVIHIGDTTVGKFYGSITIPDSEDPPRHTWGMQPIVFKYANADGYTDFVDGLFPFYPMKDYLLTAVPFGDLSDPMLAKALEDITGVSPVTKKSAVMEVPYRSMPDPKRELLHEILRLDKKQATPDFRVTLSQK